MGRLKIINKINLKRPLQPNPFLGTIFFSGSLM